MTNEQAKKLIKAKLECLKRETSGTDFDCNASNCDECPLCYEQGNMGEQKEALDLAIKALEEPERKKGKWTYGEDEYGIDGYHCDKCGFFVPWDYTHKFIDFIKDYRFCPNCGADMRGEEECC